MTLSMERSVEQLLAMHQNLKKGRGDTFFVFVLFLFFFGGGGANALEACKFPGLLTAAYGMCRPNGYFLYFLHQKSSDKGLILFKIILRRGSHFTKSYKKSKKWQIRRFEIEKWVPICENFGKTVKSAVFEEKNP